MSTLENLKPTKRNRLIDLVHEAGFNISDWYNINGGDNKAAANPKYCYEWAFRIPNELVLLNLWHEELEEINHEILHKFNFTKINDNSSDSVRKKRRIKMFEAVEDAYINNLPVRVILLSGKQRKNNQNKNLPSLVEFRYLDSEPWQVTEFNKTTKEAVIKRGFSFIKFADQFTEHEISLEKKPIKKNANVLLFQRNSEMRKKALERAKGKCEWCGIQGFLMANGKLYLETHHIIPLSEDGQDAIENMIVLCSNHHREAHYGISRIEMQKKMLVKINSN